MPSLSTVSHPELGDLHRGQWVDSTGDTYSDSWHSAEVTISDATVEVIAASADPELAAQLLTPLASVLRALPTLRREASDAIVAHFSDEAPTRAELDDAAGDLKLQSVEAVAPNRVKLHFDDSCGEHFRPGHWPAVEVTVEGVVVGVTLEA